MFKDRDVSDIAFLMVVGTVSVSVLVWAILGSIKSFRSTTETPKPTVLERAVKACINQGGIPIIKHDNDVRVENCQK